MGDAVYALALVLEDPPYSPGVGEAKVRLGHPTPSQLQPYLAPPSSFIQLLTLLVWPCCVEPGPLDPHSHPE